MLNRNYWIECGIEDHMGAYHNPQLTDIELRAKVEEWRASRKRTAARLWIMRRQLQESYDWQIGSGFYTEHCMDRYAAVQKVRDEVKP